MDRLVHTFVDLSKESANYFEWKIDTSKGGDFHSKINFMILKRTAKNQILNKL